MNRLIFLHGNKLNTDGSLSEITLERIQILNTLIEPNSKTTVVVCGGKTRKEYNSEAVNIVNYLKKSGNVQTVTKIIIEEKSKTTAENIINIKNLVRKIDFEDIDVITTKESVRRFNYLYNRLWPEVKNKLIFHTNTKPRVFLGFIEYIYFLYSHIDPENRWVKLLVNFYRNGERVSKG